jgi:methyltransferase family protein
VRTSRHIDAELLDRLPADEPSAISSRRDLRRLNVIMGHPRMIARILGREQNFRSAYSMVDLGGGDGTFLLALASKFPPRTSTIAATIVDPRSRVADETRRDLKKIGWDISVVEVDAIDFLCSRPSFCDAIIANLFLHHLAEAPLVRLLAHVAQLTPLFIACEPRRASFPLLASRLLGVIGCNHITRHDAPASVKAGFDGKELSQLWPACDGWQIEEHSVGLFSHCFVARHAT